MPAERDEVAAAPAPPQPGPSSSVRWWSASLLALAAGVLAYFHPPAIDDQLQGLLPIEHRHGPDERWLVLSLPAEAGAESETLAAAAAAVAEALGPERQPLSPPAGEATAWIDGHAFYLLPLERHEALAQRLGDESIASAAQILRAQLSSPIFGVSGLEVRRDPLSLSGLVHGRDVLGSSPPETEISSTGDLIGRDGRSLLIQLRTERQAAAVVADARSALVDLPGVEVEAWGPEVKAERLRPRIERLGPRLVIASLCAVMLVLAVASRQAGRVLAVALGLGVVAAVALALAPGWGLLSLPMLAYLVGFGCEGGLDLQRISRRAWPAAAVLATALLPLALTPYPLWQAWSWQWPLGLCAMLVAVRLAVSTLIRVPEPGAFSSRAFPLAPLPGLAVVLAAILLGAGGWAVDRLGYRGGHRLPVGDQNVSASEQAFEDGFFDPATIVAARSPGASTEAALQRAALDARALAELLPADASHLDSPGRLILTDEEIAARRRSLQKLELPTRLQVLREALQARGLRPDAFGEFLEGGTDLGRTPSAAAALAGPLGPWIEGYVRRDADGVAIVHRIHVRGAGEDAPTAVESDARTLHLVGPAIAARLDRAGFRDRIAGIVILQLGIAGLCIWAGTRSVAIAVAAAITGLAAQTGSYLILWLVGQPLGPHVLPALLLVGASAALSGARAARAVDVGHPIVAMGLLVTDLVQVAVGLALLLFAEPVWSESGFLLAVGCALGAGLGIFVAPGLVVALRRVVFRREAIR